MGGLSIWHIVIVAIIAVLLFGGRGKISELMGDVAKGIKSFRKGMSDPEEEAQPRAIPDRRQSETTVVNDDRAAAAIHEDRTAGR